MRVIYDTATGALAIDAGSAAPFGDIIEAALDRHGQTVVFDGLQFGIRVTADGTEAVNMDFPPPGVTYRQSDQDMIVAAAVRWLPDQAISAVAWIEIAGHRVEAQADFVAPRPAQPYASWQWDGAAWQPPTPCPDTLGVTWSEAALAWVTEA